MTMGRQNYSPSSYSGTTQRRGGGGKTQDTIKQIGQLKNLAELDIEEITKENGIAESFVLGLRDQLKPTQLRKFFDTIVRNQEQIREKGWDAARAEFYMIRPSLAYAKGRKLIPNEFFDLVDTCMKKIPAETEDQRIKNYDRFVDLMKAIVAYAKYHGKG
ncbi:MAG: CRISPR-associated protein Csm2 [Methanomicrobiaceae archaeon]|nr:CRISPR-associated protein Csm2 [Methanomicrobiaceae archaeon]